MSKDTWNMMKTAVRTMAGDIKDDVPAATPDEVVEA